MAKPYKKGKVWYSQLYWPEHPKSDGRGYLRQPLHPNERLAQIALGKLMEQRENKANGTEHLDDSWETFKIRFYGLYQGKSKITLRHYQRSVRKLEESYAIKSVKNLTIPMLQDLQVKWRMGGRGLSVRNRDLGNLIAMSRKAQVWGLAPHQDWELVKMEEEPRGRLLYYTPNEIFQVLGAANGVWQTITLLGARAGLRRGEMAHLEWTDIDFGRNRIHISSKKDWHIKNYENRFIPMAPDLQKHLLTLKIKAETPYILEPRHTDEVYSTYYRKILRRLKLKGSIHILRHSFGSHLASNGVSLHVIRDLMGHRSVQTTEIYAHLVPKLYDEAIVKLPPIKAERRHDIAPDIAPPRRKMG